MENDNPKYIDFSKGIDEYIEAYKLFASMFTLPFHKRRSKDKGPYLPLKPKVIIPKGCKE